MASHIAQYARALADVIFEAHLNPKEAELQLGDFAAAWRESRELRDFLLDPSFPVDQKVSVLDKMNAKLQMGQQVRNFIAVLIRNRRIGGFEEMAAEFGREVNRRLGIQEAKVTSARPLDDGERKDLEADIARLTGKQVEAHYSVDKGLIGGVVVQAGSTVYDGSVRGRLNRLREELTAG